MLVVQTLQALPGVTLTQVKVPSRDFANPGYGGPCPPPGSKPHHYHFRLYALKVEKLDLPAQASAAFVSFNVRANALAEAELMATYAR